MKGATMREAKALLHFIEEEDRSEKRKDAIIQMAAKRHNKRKHMRVQDLPSYIYRAFRDAPSGEYVAECHEIPGLSGIGETPAEALAELQEAVAGWLEALEEQGLPFPPPDAVLRKTA